MEQHRFFDLPAASLSNDSTVAHHRCLVAHAGNGLQVVEDQEHGDLKLLLNAFEQL